MRVLILCGGRGTRLDGERPKPLVEVGGRPILEHVIAIYAAQGFREFMLLTGHGGEAVAEWAAGDPRLECVDTGLDTPTGGRVHAVRDRLREPFCLTYADGVADIDLDALRARHERSGALATMTVVRPELPFGVAVAQRMPRHRVPREATGRAAGQRRLLRARAGRARYLAPTRSSSASLSSASPPTGARGLPPYGLLALPGHPEGRRAPRAGMRPRRPLAPRLQRMAGHSKWAGIKHKKAIVDARRGKLFTKLARAITVAAKEGGGDVEGNPALSLAVQKAKDASMPKDNIERAIAKGTGEGADAAALEGVVYEGYAPGGVAVLIEALTDNRNRTGSEMRHIFAKHGGNLGEPGSVAYLFDKKGVVVVDGERYAEDDLMVAIDAGAEDIQMDADVYEILCEPTDLAAVRARSPTRGSRSTRRRSPSARSRSCRWRRTPR